MNQCTCYAPNQTMTKKCLNCKTEWTADKSMSMKISSCPVHKHTIAVCGAGFFLCTTCDKDYKIERDGWFNAIVIKK